MAYLDTRRRPNAAGIVGVVGIHVALGAALYFGLTVSGVIPPPDIPIRTFEIKKPTPPPPPEKPRERTAEMTDRPITVPIPPIPIPQATPDIGTTTDILPPQPPVQPGTGEVLKPILPSATPSFAPVAAKPRTDPKRWVTTDDYRGNWIRQELTGKARFRLEIAADGRVNGCTITGSSGHPELDAATCALVTKRAKFQPARGGEGQPVAGSYSNAIDWQLPD